MKGRHTAWQNASNRPEDSEPAPDDQGEERRRANVVKKVVFWTAISACILFTLWAAYVFFAINQAIDHPEGHFDGWLCSGHSETCEP